MSNSEDEARSVSAEAERVLELADKYFAEMATGAEMVELETLMSSAPELRRLFLRYAMVHGQLSLTIPGLPAIHPPLVAWSDSHTRLDSRRSLNRYQRNLITIASVAAMLLVGAIGIYCFGSRNNRARNEADQPTAPANEMAAGSDGYYDNRNLPVHIVGVLNTDQFQNISPTTLTVDHGATHLTTTGGTDVRIEGPALFGASSSSEGVLFEGSVHARLTRPNSNYSIQTGSLRVVDRGTGFRVATVARERIRVDVLDGTVEVQTRVRNPLYYWTFDNRRARVADANEATALQLVGVLKQTPGLVGDGALVFDNQNDSFVRMTTGTGPEVGTGAMACSSGISIEALVISRWNARYRDYDEIFRKEDGNHRILLSLQNDDDFNDFDFPEVPPGPCLSFGLHLQGHGYSELDMPLDGDNGRPKLRELTDGQPHHLVATFDSFTGRKAIYVDGQLRFAHDFPVGTLIICGGPAPAEIGNHHQREPFTGTIDEVAFYNFALSPNEIADHYRRALLGKPYLVQDASSPAAPHWHAIMLIQAGTSKVFDNLTGVPIP